MRTAAASARCAACPYGAGGMCAARAQERAESTADFGMWTTAAEGPGASNARPAVASRYIASVSGSGLSHVRVIFGS